MMTKELKQRIVAAMKERRTKYASDAKMAVALGINSAQYSRVVRGELDGVIAEAKWISLARVLDVQLSDTPAWVTAKTPVFDHITRQLEFCQQHHVNGLLCDMADIGKTHTAKEYVKTHKNAVYVDCSQVKTKTKLIRQVAKEFGLDSAGYYPNVYEDLKFYLRSLPNPLVILDEFGDVDHEAFLEVKAIVNGTEGACAWYCMGADGLRAKLLRNYNQKVVGYAEILSRLGVHDDRVRTAVPRFQKITPDGREALEDFVKTQVALIGKANGMDNIQHLYAKTGGSLRRIKTEVQKLKAA